MVDLTRYKELVEGMARTERWDMMYMTKNGVLIGSDTDFECSNNLAVAYGWHAKMFQLRYQK